MSFIASVLKIGRYRQLIELMKLCDYSSSKSILEILQRHQVSVLRTNGPLVLLIPGLNNVFCQTYV